MHKKNGSLQLYIDFCHLNKSAKKDAYLLPCMQEQMEPVVGVRHFSCINLKSDFLQVNFFAVVKSFEYNNVISANFVQTVKKSRNRLRNTSY